MLDESKRKLIIQENLRLITGAALLLRVSKCFILLGTKKEIVCIKS